MASLQGTTVNGQLNVNHSTPTSILRLYSGGSTAWSLGVGDASGTNFNITADFGSILINKSTGAISGLGAVTATSFSGSGSGLTGTASSLSIGGTAATASLATTSDRLTTRDNRTISPSEDDAYRLRFGFTSWANNDSSPYADYLHLRSYSDASGGSDNLIMFRKDAIGMRIWQQSFGSATAYSSYKDVAFTDQSFFIGTTSVAINRTSGALTLNGVSISGTAGGETLGTVTGRGASTSTQISVSTSAGGSMYTGTKSGAGYSDGVSGATFKSITDHPTGGSFAFASYYNGSSGTNSFYVAADGSGYFKSLLTTGSISTGAITSAVIKADAGANYPHSFTNNDGGNTHWVNRSDRLLTSNGTNWAADGKDPIIALVTSGNSNATTIANTIGLALHNESQTNNTFSPAITFSNRSNSGSYNTTYATIIGKKTGQGIDSNWSAGELHFYTMPTGAYVNDIPSLIIDSAGEVGIGTTAPSTLLQIGTGTPTATTSGIQFGSDTSARLYRSAAATITCPGTIAATFSGNLTGNVTGNVSGFAGNVTGTVAIVNGGTGATTAANARTNLGATTAGSNFFTLTNPSAITFPRINADNTVSALDAATFRTAIGAGTGSGTVTSVGGTGTVSGLTLTGTVTTTGNLTLGGTLSVTPSNFASQTANTFLAAPNGAAGTPTFRAIVAADIPTLNQNTTGNAGSVTNGVYTNTDQNITGVKTVYVTSNTLINTVAAQNRGLAIYQDTVNTDAYMTFHIGGDYAGYFGLGGTENDLVWGGWSVGNNRYRIMHSGNSANAWAMNQGVATSNTPTFAGLTSTKAIVENKAAQSISGTVGLTLDVSSANVHVISLAASTTVSSITYNNRTADPAVNTLILVLKYSGTATVTWSNVVWANGTAPTLTGVNGYADVYSLTSYKGTTGFWIGTVVAQNLVSTNL